MVLFFSIVLKLKKQQNFFLMFTKIVSNSAGCNSV